MLLEPVLLPLGHLAALVGRDLLFLLALVAGPGTQESIDVIGLALVESLALQFVSVGDVVAGVDRASALQLSLPLVTDAGTTSIGIAGITEVVESLILELEIGHLDICVLDIACGEISLASCCRIDNEWVLRSVLGSEELLGCGVVLEDLVAFFGQEFD